MQTEASCQSRLSFPVSHSVRHQIVLPWSVTDTAIIPDRSYILEKETTSLLFQQVSPLEGERKCLTFISEFRGNVLYLSILSRSYWFAHQGQQLFWGRLYSHEIVRFWKLLCPVAFGKQGERLYNNPKVNTECQQARGRPEELSR